MESKEQDTITYPIIIETKLWEEFKDKVPRSINLNDALVDLIKQEVKRK
jgi:hypothetical protein